jgi:hypothetical protein
VLRPDNKQKDYSDRNGGNTDSQQDIQISLTHSIHGGSTDSPFVF